MLFPLSALQNWPTPNYVNPERRGPTATIVVSVLLALVTLILIVRVYTRVRISRGFGLDDVLIIFAYVWLVLMIASYPPGQQLTGKQIPTAAFAVLSFIAMWKFGWGTHVWDVPIELTKPSIQFRYDAYAE